MFGKTKIMELKEKLNEAGNLMDSGDRVARMKGENLWFSVCKDILDILEELADRIEELEEN